MLRVFNDIILYFERTYLEMLLKSAMNFREFRLLAAKDSKYSEAHKQFNNAQSELLLMF